MTNALTTTQADLIEFDSGKIDLIRRTVAKDATADELALFLHQCRRTGLDPLARQIYFQKYNSKRHGPQMTIITGIDGYRLVADRTGRYAGNDDPVFDGRVKAKFYQDDFEAPAKATVTVWKLVNGVRMPFSASAYWSEYFPGEPSGAMWRKMPHVMLAKCAEALALRKAFPADLSGVYTREEMDQAGYDGALDGVVISAESEPAPAPVKAAPATNGYAPAAAPPAAPTVIIDDGPLPDDEQVISETPTGGFVGKVLEMLPYYKAARHVGNTIKQLGYEALPDDAAGRVGLYRALKEHATQKAETN